MAVKARERYRVDLIGLQAACEANYARLMRLLPGMREGPPPRRLALSSGDTFSRAQSQCIGLTLDEIRKSHARVKRRPRGLCLTGFLRDRAFCMG